MAQYFADPLSALLELQKSLDTSFRSDWLGASPSGRGAFPPINVFRRGEDYVAVIELPGVAREDLEIEINENRIRIAGKKVVRYEDGASIHRRERIGGAFDRSIALPIEVDADRVKATYSDGLLALHLRWAERAKPRTIAIG